MFILGGVVKSASGGRGEEGGKGGFRFRGMMGVSGGHTSSASGPGQRLIYPIAMATGSTLDVLPRHVRQSILALLGVGDLLSYAQARLGGGELGWVTISRSLPKALLQVFCFLLLLLRIKTITLSCGRPAGTVTRTCTTRRRRWWCGTGSSCLQPTTRCGCSGRGPRSTPLFWAGC